MNQRSAVGSFSSALIFLTLVGTGNAERKSQEKCTEYGKLVYRDEAAPVLRLGASTNKVSTCGIVETPLIIGGVKAKPREFPHMVVIGYGEPVSWQCGGSLISDSYVLTAAHCIQSDKGPASKVMVGSIKLKSPDPTNQERKVADKILHPEYKAPSKYHDIALIKVDKPFEFGPDVRPACLEVSPDPPEKSAIACGFGRTAYESSTGSDDLMKVSVNYVPLNDCKKRFSEDSGSPSLPQGVMEKMICAGVMEGGKDTCQGDSGGPLQRVLKEPYCMYSVVGVTSFGKFCAFKDSPAIYTRVHSYLDWIEGIVWP